ncbi:hypothetical protein [Verrucomicrobium sp. BvORR106]|uniref:hypothetical protein n=1 Tax=Verrucomicrobium sp. BvORR106 TaxID=1403819 RepID=UPI00057053A1|nr:hypothetical protein [Verrucomicrobium sp. BvORR106]
MPSLSPYQDAIPFLWLGGFALCLGLHLLLHPLAKVFRQALNWLGRHPAPVLWLTASLTFSRYWDHRLAEKAAVIEGAQGNAAERMSLEMAPWPEVFVDGLISGWQQFGLLFHRVLAFPSLWPGHWADATLLALICAFTQVWFGCYLINTRNIFTEEGLSLRQTLVRWPNVILLAACQWPWWWIQKQPGPEWNFAKHWLLPEYLLFLAPLPLAIATLRGSVLAVGELTLHWWLQRGGLLASFAITALPILALLHFCLGVLPDQLLVNWPMAKFFMEGVLIATIHLWLFVSAALLLLWGGYVDDAPVSLEEA